MSRATPLARSQFVDLAIYYADKVVVMRRTAAPFERVADIDGAIATLVRALPDERRKGHTLFIDTLAAPLRTEPSLDPAFARFRSESERGFERAIVVVSTVVGRMRSDRLGQVTRIPFTVVGSIDEAWALLGIS